MSHRSWLALSLLVLLGACAAAPKVETQVSGAAPAGASYAFSAGSAEDPDLRAAVADRLQRLGLSASERAGYLLDLAYAERPAETGLIVPDRSASEWLSAPEFRRRKRVARSVTVTLTEVASGREVYRASAVERRRGRAGDDAATRLAAAALADPAAR